MDARLAIAIALLPGAPCMPPAPAGDRRVRLGARDLAKRREVGAIPDHRGRNRRIRICTRGSAIRFRPVDMRFANGAHQEIDLRERLPAGDCSEPMRLGGDGPRRIREVRVVSRDVSRPGRGARVTVDAR